ncbi:MULTISPECIES: hypothetical protein [Rhizobium]|uniref:Lipoprotein n=1 Tax=Rhizobium johnstonii (strain DSM 114642 / LMG 32736 / 3841) TaxID=216596 RepID=Q1MHA0_RHIJ3|nr:MULTISPECIES: hypothetical protein [Rhizobium]NEI92373.1 hypothetical protein [Rhizobium leguminosarum]NEJ79129.1 hypothetical protein [Rhizobium leguminosarum]CAK07666.1 conserved hypothetical protein [Rhizobium johnstonii 3841]
MYAKAWLGVMLLASGCALHPVPENYMRISTLNIVKQVRCETRNAIMESAIGWLTHDKDVDGVSRQVGFSLQADPDKYTKLTPALFKGRVHELFSLFWQTGIAFDYVLDMTEINNVSTEFNLLSVFTGSTRTLGFSAGLDRQRESERIFTTTDTFGNLIHGVRDDFCEEHIAKENMIYPIAGKIGIAGVIQDFMRLTLFGNLAGRAENRSGPPTLAERLQFTTTITGSISPKIVFAGPGGPSWRLADASLSSAVATRTDNHQVTIGLAIASSDAGAVGPLRGTLYGPLLTATGNPTELLAASAAQQSISRDLAKQRTTVVISP